MIQFGNIKKLSLRDIWAKEATEFTPWLSENIEALGNALGIELELQGTEQNVGDFALDLLAKDLGTGRNVVIENQLSPTDHDHLGKLLTYAAGFNAAVIIWLSEEIREEHRQALDWLNQRTDEETDFFGVVVEVLQIDDSRPAYNFKPVVFPNEWQKNKKRIQPATSERGELYRIFFQELIDELRDTYKFTGAKLGQPQSWYAFSSGIKGVLYDTSFAQGGKARVGLYIDTGNLEENKKLFDLLKEDQKQIENEIAMPLEWERLDNKRASRIFLSIQGSIDSDPALLKDIRAWMVDYLLKFKKVFLPRLKKIMTE